MLSDINFFSAIFITSTLRATSITTPCNSTLPCWRRRSNSSTTSWTTWKSIYSRLEPIWHLEKVRNLISVFIFHFLIGFDWILLDSIGFYLTSIDLIWFILFHISSFDFPYFVLIKHIFLFLGDELARIPFLRTWFRTSRAVVMFLTNGTLQVSF